jgi:hypothetical protein
MPILLKPATPPRRHAHRPPLLDLAAEPLVHVAHGLADVGALRSRANLLA